ncbi:MAG: hypothetical protein JO026_02425 [Patescibacteria group bacterium]|nr:hypothetical protein [Patescibacteria group bacterium]
MKEKAFRGYFVILVLIFSAVFMTLVAGLTGYIFVQKKLQLAEENRQKANNLAEAGLEYYRWHLAHFPNDLTDGTGKGGPYTHTVNDPEGGNIGSFSLGISGDTYCGSVTDVAITSVGTSAADPTYTRTLLAKYARPSVADYSYIVNSNVWVGADRIISGPYFSNGGIRMDGTHNSTVSSGVATWLCTSDFGCSPNATKNGVFGAGGPSSLWNYPAAPIDFNGLSVNLASLKNYATTSGSYLGPSGNYGYKIVFNADGSFDSYKVTGTQAIWGYSTQNGWQQERSIITGTAAAVHHVVSASCPVVFVEDNAWVEGTVSGKVTIAAANESGSGADKNVILSNNITYAHSSGDGLVLIGQGTVLISLQSPDTMQLHGIFIAQDGWFGRNHYTTSGSDAVPASLSSYVLRSILNTYGTVVTNGRTGTKWTDGNGNFISGYSQRNDTYDRSLSFGPPPFTPSISNDYKFVLWQDQDVPF